MPAKLARTLDRVVNAAFWILFFASPFVVRTIWRVSTKRLAAYRDRRRPPVSLVVPIERVTADLRRLRVQLEARENRIGGGVNGMRMGAVRVAYVELLCVACRQLDIVPPRGHADWHTPLAEIYRVEAQLRDRGLDVRQDGYRRAA